MTEIWDDDDRAIARALDAATPAGEPADVDADAVADYETVLGYLPFDEVPPRDLEDQVVAASLARRPASARTLDSKRGAGRRVRSSPRWIAAAAGVAAAVIVGVLIAGRPGSGPGTPAARIEPAAASGGLARVLAEPDVRRGVLRTPRGVTAGQVVLDRRGDGYLTDLQPSAPGPTARWLWLDTASGPVRVGKLAPASVVHFVVRGDVDAVRGVIVASAPAGQTPSAPARVRLRGSLPLPG